MGHNESSTKRKTHSPECLQKKQERAYTGSLTSYLKTLVQRKLIHPIGVEDKRSSNPALKVIN